jgi:hypothetical protein
MLSSIQHSSSGLEALINPVAKETAGNVSSPDHFDQVMDRTLARDSDSSHPDRPAGQTQGKASRQKPLARPPANSPRTAAKPSSPSPAQDSPSSEASLLTSDSSSRGKARSTSSERRRSDRAANDAAHAVAEATSLLQTVPGPALKLKGIGYQPGATAPASAIEVTAAGAECKASPTSVECCDGANESSVKPAGAPNALAASTNLQMQESSATGIDADNTGAAAEKSQNSRQAHNSPEGMSGDLAPADWPNAQPPCPDGLALPGLAAASPDKLTPGADGGVQIKPPSQHAHGPPTPGPGEEFSQAFGTSVAQQETTMKKAQKVQKTAEPSLQNLPGEGVVTAEQDKSAAVQPSSTSSSADLERAAIATANGPANSLDAAGTTNSNAVTSPTAVDLRLTSLERTHDLVAMHALRLTQSGNDSLRVVLEPGGGTSLSLDLRFTNGSIEAQALLHRGDFQFLNNHWAELQQWLEPRGIHLGDLKCSDQSNGGQERFDQSERQSPEQQPTRSAFAEFAFDDAMADSAAARRSRTKTHAGWETWA